jgi:hypothetical protein
LEATSPGVKTSQELKILMDESVFLPLPAGEVPVIAPPDTASQRQMMGLVVNYVSKTIHQLPNFYATRVTTQFEETPQRQTTWSATPYLPLHATKSFAITVLYRDGREVVDAGKVEARGPREEARGLRDWGVFGPILSTVVLDAARSSLTWSHWEQAGASIQAVFRYAVPEANSHYRVNYCCLPRPDPESGPSKPFDHIAGYHGEIAIDPQVGSILRLTVEADLRPIDPVSTADIMVEYGAVEIGGKSYICATRSVAFSTALSMSYFGSDFIFGGFVAPGPAQRLLNDVVFEEYHVFRPEVRVFTGDGKPH